MTCHGMPWNIPAHRMACPTGCRGMHRHPMGRDMGCNEDWFCDIAPPKSGPAIFFNEGLMATRHVERYNRKQSYLFIFLYAKGLSIDDVGVSRDAVFVRKYDRGLVLKPTISLMRSWGGYRSKTLRCHEMSHGVPREGARKHNNVKNTGCCTDKTSRRR